MEYIRAKGTGIVAVDVLDLSEEQAQMVQAFADFLRDQMRTQATGKEQDTYLFSPCNLTLESDLNRSVIYERI